MAGAGCLSCGALPSPIQPDTKFTVKKVAPALFSCVALLGLDLSVATAQGVGPSVSQPRPGAALRSNRIGNWWLVGNNRGAHYPQAVRPQCPLSPEVYQPLCTVRPPARMAVIAMGSSDDDVPGWHAGLRPPSYAQHPCPAGTATEPAVANPNVIRCVPR